jgi:hypothetical protein
VTAAKWAAVEKKPYGKEAEEKDYADEQLQPTRCAVEDVNEAKDADDGPNENGVKETKRPAQPTNKPILPGLPGPKTNSLLKSGKWKAAITATLVENDMINGDTSTSNPDPDESNTSTKRNSIFSWQQGDALDGAVVRIILFLSL